VALIIVIVIVVAVVARAQGILCFAGEFILVIYATSTLCLFKSSLKSAASLVVILPV
jgi:hypothetical protein